MQIEQIEIHADDLDRPYESLGHLNVKATAATLFSRAPTIEEVNFKLREKAAALGANAVVRVTYSRGMSMTSYKALTATGIAVRAEPETVDCPECAEPVRRAAKKCKHCGAALVPSGPVSEG